MVFNSITDIIVFIYSLITSLSLDKVNYKKNQILKKGYMASFIDIYNVFANLIFLVNRSKISNCSRKNFWAVCYTLNYALKNTQHKILSGKKKFNIVYKNISWIASAKQIKSVYYRKGYKASF